MDLNFTDDELAFREEVRGWVKANLPADIKHKVLEHKRLTKDDMVRWQKILNGRGWFGAAWPAEFGGSGLNAVQRHILDEELSAEGAPQLIPFGVAMVGPVIMAFGNDAQKRHYLPRILDQTDWWCQGYSEPGSGSDLASLKTRAERQGEHYLVNGQKTWTTLGQYANMMFCLVRTSTEARKQEGISFILVDMTSPGVTVRPIITIDGEHEVNEVFLDNVKVPVANLVGTEGKGWTCAKFLLSHERSGIARVGISKRELAHVKRIASQEIAYGRPLIEDPLFRARLAQVEIDLMAMELTGMRLLSAERAGKAPGPEASMLKIRGTEIQQAITELLMQAVGPYALPFTPEAFDGNWHGEPVGPDYAAPLAARYFNYRKTSIYGGSNEIQKNIISQMILGL
jgi:alkylation response protein AidB-like acyl-CoA dehydrogenase